MVTYILKSLNFQKNGESFDLKPIDNSLINQILRITTNGFIVKDTYTESDPVNVKLISVKINDDRLSINIIYYDSGNSEFTMPFEKFDSIFLEELRKLREKKLNKIGI